jgi:hypothetical protein
MNTVLVTTRLTTVTMRLLFYSNTSASQREVREAVVFVVRKAQRPWSIALDGFQNAPASTQPYVRQNRSSSPEEDYGI